MSLLKAFTKWFAIGIGGLVVLTGLAFVAAKTDAFDEWLRGKLSAAAAERGARLEAQDFDFDPAGPSFHLGPFRLQGPDGRWDASWDQLDLRLHLARTLLDEPTFSISAKNPRITYTLDAANASGDARGALSAELPRIAFRSLEIENGSFELIIPALDASLRLDAIRADWKGPEGSVTAGGGSLRWRGVEERLLAAESRGKRTLTGTDVPAFSLRTDHALVQGSLSTGLKGALKGKAQATLALDEMPPEWLAALGLEASAPVGAEVSLQGDLAGTTDSPDFSGAFRLTKGRFATLDVPLAEGRLAWKNSRLTFSDGAVKTSAGAARSMGGTLAFGKTVELDAQAEAVGFDLREAMRLVSSGRFPVGFTATGKVSAKGRLWPDFSLDCAADAEAWNLDVGTLRDGQWREWYALPHVRGKVRGVVSAAGADILPGRLDGGSVAVEIGKGRIDYRTGLEFDTDVEIRNLESVRRYLPQGMETFGRAKGRFGGPYHALTFTYDLALNRCLIYGEEWGTLAAHAEYDLKTLKVTDGRISGPQGDIAAQGSAVLLPEGTYDLAAAWEKGRLASFLRFLERFGVQSPVPFDGALSARGRVSGPLLSPVFEGDVSAREFTAGSRGSFQGFAGERVDAHGRFGLYRWEVDALNADAYGAQWTASGAADRERFDLSLAVKNLPAASAGSLFGVSGLGGVLSGSGAARGTYRRTTAEAAFEVAGGVHDGLPLGDLAGKLRFDGQNLSGEAERKDGKARARGTMDDQGLFSLEAQADALPWNALPPAYLPSFLHGSEVSGSGKLAGKALGEDARVQSASFKGLVENASAWDIPLGSAEVALAYPAALPGVENALVVDAGLWKGEAALRVGLPLGEDGKLVVEAVTRQLDLSRLEKLKPLRGGRLTGSGAVRFSSRPRGGEDWAGLTRLVEKFEANGRVEDLHLEGWEPLSLIDFEAASSGGPWDVSARWNGLPEAKGRFDPATLEWEAAATLSGYNPLSLFPQWKDDVSVELSGDLALRGKGGSLERIEGKGSFERLIAWTTGPNAGTWSLEGSSREILYHAETSTGLVTEGRWSPKTGFRGEARAQRASLAPWLPKKPWAEKLLGVLTGAVHYAVDEESGFTADATLTEVELNLEPLAIKNRGDVEIFWRDGGVSFHSTELRGGEFSFFVEGSAIPGKEWNLRLHGSTDLAVVAEMVPALSTASGRAEYEFSAVGPWDRPVLGGTLNIPGGAKVKFTDLDLPFEQLSAHAVLEPSGVIHIDHIDATFGAGTLHGEGEWKLEGLKPGEMTIFWEAKDISYEYPTGVSYTFDGEFLLTGRYTEAQLRGEVRLEKFLYARRFGWGTVALDLFKQFSQRSQIEKMVTRKGVVFVDLSVTGNRDLRVENNLADLSLTADLRVRGYLPNPVLWGRLDVAEGTVRFREREFTLLRSSLEFLGDVGPVAMLDGRASGQVGEYTVNIAATGPLDDVKVELTSSPPLARTDIVALLALGTTTENLEQGGGGVTAFEATNLLIGGIQDELESEMHSTFGLDQFHIDPAYSQARQSTEPRVTVGKALGDNLYARYGALFGSQTEQNVTLEYLITPGVLLLGSWSDEGTAAKGSFGAKVRFRFTFR